MSVFISTKSRQQRKAMPLATRDSGLRLYSERVQTSVFTLLTCGLALLLNKEHSELVLPEETLQGQSLGFVTRQLERRVNAASTMRALQVHCVNVKPSPMMGGKQGDPEHYEMQKSN